MVVTGFPLGIKCATMNMPSHHNVAGNVPCLQQCCPLPAGVVPPFFFFFVQWLFYFACKLAFGSSCASLQFNCNCLMLLESFLVSFWNGPVLKARHWLPVLYVLQLHNASTPQYLADLLQIYTPSRTLRSTTDRRKLKIPLLKKKYSGQRSVSYQGPICHTHMYSLFKSQLKTHWFSQTLQKNLVYFLFLYI